MKRAEQRCCVEVALDELLAPPALEHRQLLQDGAGDTEGPKHDPMTAGLGSKRLQRVGLDVRGVDHCREA
jgi:hypothetical protein